MPDEQTISERVAAAWTPLGPMAEQAKELILRDLRALESDYAVMRSTRHVPSEASQDA